MPGLFYHFVCLMRSWGLEFADPPMFGIYPSSVSPEMLSQTAPQLLAALSLYLLSYELVYYWWHRAMHEVPALYKWVHKHHHQQTYPDRAALDTFNTGCIESQVLHLHPAPAPCILHPAPCTLHPAPCTLHPAPSPPP